MSLLCIGLDSIDSVYDRKIDGVELEQPVLRRKTKSGGVQYQTDENECKRNLEPGRLEQKETVKTSESRSRYTPRLSYTLLALITGKA